MRTSNKFIFTCLTAVILFAPIFSTNVLSAYEDIKHKSQAASQKHKEILDSEKKSHEENSAEHIAADKQTEEHGVSHIWPHYGKMVIFAKIMFAFMLFSFIAPLSHFYIKGEKHH